MTGNNDGVIRRARDGLVGPLDCAIDTAAVFVIYLRIDAIPEGVAQRQHIRFLEVDPQIAIGMAAAEVFNCDLASRERKCFFLVDQQRRTRACRHRIEGPVPGIDVRGFGQMLQGILVRDDGGAGVVHPRIAISVVPMPMRVDHVFQRRRADVVKRGLQFFLRLADASVNQGLPFLAGTRQ